MSETKQVMWAVKRSGRLIRDRKLVVLKNTEFDAKDEAWWYGKAKAVKVEVTIKEIKP